MAKTGLYHPPDTEPIELTVLAENADGTVNIGHEIEGKDPEVIVRSCPLSKVAKHGHFLVGAKLAPAKAATEEPAATEEKSGTGRRRGAQPTE
jgi:hypothetical protein